MPETRKAAILGGNRIPFARSNGAYSKASNQDLLTAALDGLVDRHGLAGERIGEVAGGAVVKLARDINLTRESVLGTKLAPETPAYDVGQACGTGLETTILVANKIQLGQIDSGIASGTDTTSDPPIAVSDDVRARADRAQQRPLGRRPAQGADQAAPVDAARHPQERRAAHRPLDGRAHGDHGEGVGADPRGAGPAHRRQPPAPRRRLRPRLHGRPRHALPRARARQQPAPRLDDGEAGEAEARLRRPRGDDDRGQLDAAHRRRLLGPARLRGVGVRARDRAARLLRRRRDRGGRLRDQEGGPADGARLRGPADARPQRPRRCRTSTSTRSTRRSPPRSCAR